MRATMTGSFLNKGSVEKFISKQAFILAKETETVVTSILRAATYGTPKWSGFATEAWTVSFNKTVSATKNDNGGKPPEYDGIGGGLAAPSYLGGFPPLSFLVAETVLLKDTVQASVANPDHLGVP